MSNGLRTLCSAPLRDTATDNERATRWAAAQRTAIDSLMSFARAIFGYRVCAVSFN
jgi:hypothetical protein